MSFSERRIFHATLLGVVIRIMKDHVMTSWQMEPCPLSLDTVACCDIS